MKKKIVFLALIFFLVNVNAYETNVEIKTIEDVVPTTQFYHWIILDWTYTGPIGETDWQECDFESPDKNYGIFLDLGTGFPYNPLLEEFGPTTTEPECETIAGETECTARTTYFFKLKHYYEGAYTIPINIRGKCGVVDEDLAYPIDMNFDYTFTVNTSYAEIVPDINYTTRWGKTPGGFGPPRNAELKVVSHDPQNKDITEIEWILPGGCNQVGPQIDSGMYTPDANSEISLRCTKTGIKLLIVSAENEDGKGFKAFLTYFSVNDNEVEFEHIHNDVLIGLPNVGRVQLLFQWNLLNNYDYKASSVNTKSLTVLKDTGNGLPEETDYGINLENSTPFVSVEEPECPAMGTHTPWGSSYAGEDFTIIERGFGLLCEPGNHKITLNSSGTYSDGSPFNLTDDFNFVAVDINFNILNLVKSSEELSSTYGIVYGEDGRIDLNIIIDNYSPEYVTITDVNFVYIPYLSTPLWYGGAFNTCDFDETEFINETETRWKINSYLECTRFHLFYPIVYLSGYPEFRFPGELVFWVSAPTDKLKMDSITIENLYDSIWYPDQNQYCNFKTGTGCHSIYPGGDGVSGLISLPQDTLKITKGDLLRFHSTITNVYSQPLNAEVILTITDSQGNEVAEISQSKIGSHPDGQIPPLTKTDFDILFYDTDYLKESQLYAATATVYWVPVSGFSELDEKPLNNTKTIYFYVMGDTGLIENLPETNLTAIIVSLIFVLFILAKK